jgi:transposase
MSELNAFELLVPEELLEYFTLEKGMRESDSYHLYLSEKNIPPEQYEDKKLLSKGFFEPITVQDFPLRGKPCFLHVKRRRWTVEDTGQVVYRNWDIVAQGTRMTQEFASFLKGINRY